MRSVLFALPALLAACVSNGVQPLKPLEIVTVPYSPTVTSSATGSLAYERGCLQFYDESGKQMWSPVWPDGTIFNGTSVVFHKPGRADQPIVLNQEFLLSGQPLTWSTVPSPRATEFQRQCGGTPFAVADVAPAN
ncbi:MAG: hypothetical protein ACJ8FO_04710 [Sphingomicrobium sp.]